jgi:hypothetical protein
MRLDEALRRHPWDRVKGVLATRAGWVCINRVAGVGDIAPHPGAEQGRLEIIHHRPLEGGHSIASCWRRDGRLLPQRGVRHCRNP